MVCTARSALLSGTESRRRLALGLSRRRLATAHRPAETPAARGRIHTHIRYYLPCAPISEQTVESRPWQKEHRPNQTGTAGATEAAIDAPPRHRRGCLVQAPCGGRPRLPDPTSTTRSATTCAGATGGPSVDRPPAAKPGSFLAPVSAAAPRRPPAPCTRWGV